MPVIDDEMNAILLAESELSRRAGSPPMELIDEPKNFVLTTFIPWAEREDVRVDVAPHRMVVTVLPRSAAEAHVRRDGLPVYQDFERAIPLPSEVNPELAEAHLNEGVLEVIMPKVNPGGVQYVYRLPAM